MSKKPAGIIGDAFPDTEKISEALMMPSASLRSEWDPEKNYGVGEIETSEILQANQDIAMTAALVGNKVLQKHAGSLEKEARDLMDAMAIKTTDTKASSGGVKFTMPAEARDAPNAIHMENQQKAMRILLALLGEQRTREVFACAARCGFRKKMGLWLNQKLQEALKTYKTAILEPESQWDEPGSGDSDPSAPFRGAVMLIFGEDTTTQLIAVAKSKNIGLREVLRKITDAQVAQIVDTDANSVAMQVDELAALGLA